MEKIEFVLFLKSEEM